MGFVMLLALRLILYPEKWCAYLYLRKEEIWRTLNKLLLINDRRPLFIVRLSDLAREGRSFKNFEISRTIMGSEASERERAQQILESRHGRCILELEIPSKDARNN